MSRKNKQKNLPVSIVPAVTSGTPTTTTTTSSVAATDEYWEDDMYNWGLYGQKDTKSQYKGAGATTTTTYKPCHLTHKPLKVCEGIYINGGSCSSPTCLDCDIYIGLDGSMRHDKRAYPWEPGHSFYYPITDYCAPSNPVSFHKLIDFICENLTAGKKIQVGCIGGHGRTGTVLAAVVKQMSGEEDAIEYVRKNYCTSAVESQAQIDFLHKEFGIKKTKPGKEWGGADSWYGTGTGKTSGAEKYEPIPATHCLWGPETKLLKEGKITSY